MLSTILRMLSLCQSYSFASRLPFLFTAVGSTTFVYMRSSISGNALKYFCSSAHFFKLAAPKNGKPIPKNPHSLRPTHERQQTPMTHPLFNGDPVLAEVTPNAANIYQYQEPPDANLEEWIAVAGGGFTKPLDVTMCQMKLSCTTPPPAGAAHVTSPKRKRGEMQNGGAAFFDTSNRCTNTHCTYPPGHDGLCSHMKVAGRRKSRSAVRAAA